MNREFINKMMEAKRLEGQALMSILPENVRCHVEVIGKEIKAILLECVTECTINRSGQRKDNEGSDGKVHKVEIE